MTPIHHPDHVSKTYPKGAAMPARPLAQRPIGLNHLRRGVSYRAVTRNGAEAGEYLGMESRHGDRAILLRGPLGTVSIVLQAITSIRAVAA
jgi:hypothetical protein